MKQCRRRILLLSLITFFCLSIPASSFAQSDQVISLTLDSAVDIAINNSYRVRQLRMGIERTRHNLRSRQAGLKSRVYMNLSMPEINSTSDYKWNSVLGKDEIVREDTRRWEAELSIRQPVILFGYPTNGYLSLNNKVYRYLQQENSHDEVDYYNRYFVRYEQPFFQPNELKNDIEEARLDLEQEELEFLDDIADLIDDIADDYYDIFHLDYSVQIYREQSALLTSIVDLVNETVSDDSDRSPEMMQVQIALTNMNDRLSETQKDLRSELTYLKQRLRLESSDSLSINARLEEIVPLEIDTEKAVEYGLNLRPRMRQLHIDRRNDEIDLENTKARNSFRVNLEMTYGLEKQDQVYDKLWNDQDTSYSVSLNAYIPIWDWGERKERIAAEEISLRQTDLTIEENRRNIAYEIRNAIDNLREYQARALSMAENLEMSQELTELSLERYRNGRISLTDLMTIVDSKLDSELNLLDAYVGYRNSLNSLLEETYYDFEHDMPLLERILEEEDIALELSNN